MSRFVVQILPIAEQEFREAFLWYYERSAVAADAFRLLVFEAIDDLADHADMWPADEEGIHFRVVTDSARQAQPAAGCPVGPRVRPHYDAHGAAVLKMD